MSGGGGFGYAFRRISLLSYFHCGHRRDDLGFKDLIEQAGHIKIVKRVLYWHDWERYSNRQETRMKMGGFMGEYVHVGKGCSFGLGRYGII